MASKHELMVSNHSGLRRVLLDGEPDSVTLGQTPLDGGHGGNARSRHQLKLNQLARRSTISSMAQLLACFFG